MNNECGAKYFDATGLLHMCELVRNHEGAHYDYRFRRTWPQNHPYGGYFKGYAHTTPVLEFTTHELAELYVILSGNHDIPEVYLNKVAAALKEML